ncbi:MULTISPECIES: DUF2007 domain-containing protein [unclassified Lysobacter]|jgi:hypothetical protein|uniref:putative signal transducing protein n=1 Tax=unclassified Lysobacter TaxID=2635362 RepID=UPI001F58A141|nr:MULTISPECIES: DUF2007 domain-containing protein [unclassified Lysobacter]HEX5663162.1 DUF2007 domain-containing protein [Xanthomonadaceae bacterium]
MFTTIASYHDPIEAHIACGRLRAEGIDAHVADDQMAVANWEWRLAVGGTRLRVADTDAERARSVLRELDAGGFALDVDAAGERALQLPERESLSSRIAWVALMLFNIPLPWRRRNNDDAVREA